MAARVNFGGLVIAGIGFFLTRFTVTLAIYESPIRFYFAGVIPLLLGLGLAAFGVAIAVADLEADLVRSTAGYCVFGLLTMLVLVLLTLLGSTEGSLPDLTTLRSQAYLSNFLIGGSIGGTMTGMYAARNRRQRREIRQHANRLQVLNRLLRHEVLNAVTVIQGWVNLEGSDEDHATSVIEAKSKSIERTIDEVTHLANATRNGSTEPTVVDLQTPLANAIAMVNDRYPDTTIAEPTLEDPLPVQASPRLEHVFTHLLDNAVQHTDDKSPAIEVMATELDARITISDDGPGLPERQQALLETGEIQQFDDPDTGFGLNLARLEVEDFNGSIDTETDADGTAITVRIPRVADNQHGPLPTAMNAVRPAVPHLLVTLGASLLAGVAYGIASELLGGSIAGIGVFYGTSSPVVGWLTHEFHSVVFGFVFTGLLSVAPSAYRDRFIGHVAIGLGWGIVLWAVAAGVIAPIWLQLMGIPAAIPNLSIRLLIAHLAWGVSLGSLTAVGFDHVSPRLADLGTRLRLDILGG